MQLLQPFDATLFDPTQSQGQLPIGKHLVVAESSEVVPTAKNDGGMLVYMLKVNDGPNVGATGPYRLNLYNQSEKAKEIAHKQMSALCHVTGVYKVTDSSQLHDIPFMIEVVAQTADPKYTEVKKIFDRNGNEPGKQGAQQSAQPAPQPSQQFAPAQQQAPQQPAWPSHAAPVQQQPVQAWQQNQPQGGAPANQPPWAIGR